MQILGLGTDIVEIARIEKMLAGHPGRFEERVCTPQELEIAGTKRAISTISVPSPSICIIILR